MKLFWKPKDASTHYNVLILNLRIYYSSTRVSSRDVIVIKLRRTIPTEWTNFLSNVRLKLVNDYSIFAMKHWLSKFDQLYEILERAPYKTAAVEPPTTHHENYEN